MSETKSAAPHKHPLHQLRDILEWSREDCAKQTGLKTATIQNIERGAAPLPEDAAFAIEAATSCNAMKLMESAEAWRKAWQEKNASFLTSADLSEAVEFFAPKTLNGSLFTKETYESYRQSALSAEDAQQAIDDLWLRIDLLLGPLASKPEKFRRMYRYLAQLLNKERRESGPSDSDMAEYALQQGSSELKEMTIGELAATKEVADSPAWNQIETSGQFKPEQKTHVVLERYPFWPEIERTTSDEHYLVPDYVFGERIVYRITLPNGKPLVVTITRSRATGLRGKLTDAMIRSNKDRAGEKGAC